VEGSANQAGYAAAKAAVINLTRSLAADWARYNIRVNCVLPGLTDTPLTRRTVARNFPPEILARHVPLGRMGEPVEIARAALFLISDDASYITGVALPVDGGWLIGGHQDK
jgi:NAD(P)-dependent dehydrogenase (short-subunit alcohol dehydrogenase family)